MFNYYKIINYVKEEGSKRSEFAAYVSGLYIYIPAGVLAELRTENLESCETVKVEYWAMLAYLQHNAEWVYWWDKSIVLS